MLERSAEPRAHAQSPVASCRVDLRPAACSLHRGGYRQQRARHSSCVAGCGRRSGARFQPAGRRRRPFAWPDATDCRRCFPKPPGRPCAPGLRQAFRHDRLITAGRNHILAGAAAEVAQALHTRGIPTIVLKGLEYERRLYDAVGLPADGRRRSPRSGCASPGGISRPGRARVRASRRRPRIRRCRLPRGRLGESRNRGRPPPSPGSAGSLPNRPRGDLGGGGVDAARVDDRSRHACRPRRHFSRRAHGDRSLPGSRHLPGRSRAARFFHRRPGWSGPPRDGMAVPQDARDGNRADARILTALGRLSPRARGGFVAIPKSWPTTEPSRR